MSFEKFEQPPIPSAKKEKKGEEMKIPFKNPEGYWGHQGAFTVEMAPGANKDYIPKDVVIEENVVKVKDGRIEQQMGGIVFFSKKEGFRFPYREIKAIRDGDGHLLWVNNNYRSEVLGGGEIKKEKVEGEKEEKKSSYHSAGGPRSRIGESKRAARQFSKERR